MRPMSKSCSRISAQRWVEYDRGRPEGGHFAPDGWTGNCSFLQDLRARGGARGRKAMKYTAGEAASATGLNTATITRAIKKGRISATKSDTGAWQIDPAELHRVFPPLAGKALTQGEMQGDARAFKEKSKSTNNALQGELEAMRERLAGAEQRAAVAEALAEERGKRLDQLVPLLPRTAPAPVPVADARPWWRKIF